MKNTSSFARRRIETYTWLGQMSISGLLYDKFASGQSVNHLPSIIFDDVITLGSRDAIMMLE